MDLVNGYIDGQNTFIPLNWEDNKIEKTIEKIVAEVKHHGAIGEIRVYIDNKILPDPVRKLLMAKGIHSIDTVPLNGNGKGSDDQAMFLDLAQLPYRQPNVTTAVVVAGDGDYTRAVATLSQHGVKTILMSTHNGNSSILEKAAGCTYIDISQDEDLNSSAEGRVKHGAVNEGNGKQKEEDKCNDAAALLRRSQDLIHQYNGDLDRRMLIAEIVQNVDEPAAIGHMAHRIGEFFREGIIEHYFVRENGSQEQRIRLSREAMEQLI